VKTTFFGVFGLFGLALLISLPAFGQMELPKPTGKYGIGRSVLDWTNPAQKETQSETPGSQRELLVYLFYPIDADARGVRAEYFPHLKEVKAYEEQFGKNFFRESYVTNRALRRSNPGICGGR
jgi:hypothetical protein